MTPRDDAPAAAYYGTCDRGCGLLERTTGRCVRCDHEAIVARREHERALAERDDAKALLAWYAAEGVRVREALRRECDAERDAARALCAQALREGLACAEALRAALDGARRMLVAIVDGEEARNAERVMLVDKATAARDEARALADYLAGEAHRIATERMLVRDALRFERELTAALRSERDAARYLRAGYGRLARVARREHERALAERDAARDALARFGEHDLDCGVHPDPPRALDGPCTCGLSAALRGPSR